MLVVYIEPQDREMKSTIMGLVESIEEFSEFMQSQHQLPKESMILDEYGRGSAHYETSVERGKYKEYFNFVAQPIGRLSDVKRKAQAEIVKQRLSHHFGRTESGDWNIEGMNAPFMKEFLKEVEKLCNS